LVAITSDQYHDTTLAMMGIDAHMLKTRPGTGAKSGHWRVSNDGCMYRIFSRFGNHMKPMVWKGRAL
jgi:hypothetical protein